MSEFATADKVEGGFLVRRRKHVTDEMPIDIEIDHARRFTFSLPDGVPFDNEDSDRIIAELEQLQPPPHEILGPVASGVGDLVSEAFDVIYWNDKREDYEIMLDIEDAVKRGLRCRAFFERE